MKWYTSEGEEYGFSNGSRLCCRDLTRLSLNQKVSSWFKNSILDAYVKETKDFNTVGVAFRWPHHPIYFGSSRKASGTQRNSTLRCSFPCQCGFLEISKEKDFGSLSILQLKFYLKSLTSKSGKVVRTKIRCEKCSYRQCQNWPLTMDQTQNSVY